MITSLPKPAFIGPCHAHSARAFSLIEIVLSLGVFSLIFVSILGLLNVGVSDNKGSSDQIQAADLASLLLATRRASPTNTGFNFSTFSIPPLNVPATNTTEVGINGTTSIAGLAPSEVFALKYMIGTGVTPHVALVHLLIWWPASAPAPRSSGSDSCYEITTQVALP